MDHGTAYTRVTSAGEIESNFRLERGRNFKITLDPETEQFAARVGSSKMSLFPLLKATKPL